MLLSDTDLTRERLAGFETLKTQLPRSETHEEVDRALFSLPANFREPSHCWTLHSFVYVQVRVCVYMCVSAHKFDIKINGRMDNGMMSKVPFHFRSSRFRVRFFLFRFVFFSTGSGHNNSKHVYTCLPSKIRLDPEMPSTALPTQLQGRQHPVTTVVYIRHQSRGTHR